MKFLQILSLRQMLTLPYVVLVLVLAAAIGGLSYSAGRVAVDTLSNQLLSEMVYRIAQAAERHVFGASAVLETAFPAGVAAPEDINDDLDNLRTRFWLATSVHRDPTITPTTAIVAGAFSDSGAFGKRRRVAPANRRRRPADDLSLFRDCWRTDRSRSRNAHLRAPRTPVVQVRREIDGTYLDLGVH